MVRRDEAQHALRRKVTGREFEFATVLEVTDGGPAGFLLRVRAGQRIHPHTLILAAVEESLTLEHSIGEPLDTDDAEVEVWANGVHFWLMEELDSASACCVGGDGSRSTMGRSPSTHRWRRIHQTSRGG